MIRGDWLIHTDFSKKGHYMVCRRKDKSRQKAGESDDDPTAGVSNNRTSD
jgi:hypothetical protein